MLMGEKTILRRVEQADLWQIWRWHEEQELLLLREQKPYLTWDELNESYMALFGWQGTFIAEEKAGFAFGIFAYRDLNWKNRCCRLSLQLVRDKKECALDALQALVEFLCNELGVHRIYSSIPDFLVTEDEIYRCCGFICEGNLREAFFWEGSYCDVVTYSLLSINAERQHDD